MRAACKVQELTGIGAVKVPGPGLIRIRVLWDLFPCEGFDVEHVNVCDHPSFCDEAASLYEAKVCQSGFDV
jgi:hypothetical protein